MRQALKQYLPMVAGALLMSGTTVIGQSMASMLEPGSVAALTYGNKMVAFALGIGNVALGTAVFPHFARMTSVGDWSGIRHTLKTYVRLILLIVLPFTALLIYLSGAIVQVVFERGAFTAQDTALVARTQAFYLLQTPFHVIGILGVRLLSALGCNQNLMVISAANLVVNVAGNFVLMSVMGVEGISLSTSIVYAFSMTLIFLVLRSTLNKNERQDGNRS